MLNGLPHFAFSKLNGKLIVTFDLREGTKKLAMDFFDVKNLGWENDLNGNSTEFGFRNRSGYRPV